jgi:virulence-associated protein VapD
MVNVKTILVIFVGGNLIMDEKEKTKLYLEKLRLYFEDIQKTLKHLEFVVKQDDKLIQDINLIGIKAMCGSLYLCMFYINQISIVANQKDLMKLSDTIHKVYLEHKPILDKIHSEMGLHTAEEFKEKGLNFVGGNDTMQ